MCVGCGFFFFLLRAIGARVGWSSERDLQITVDAPSILNLQQFRFRGVLYENDGEGPGIFLAQFSSDAAALDTVSEGMGRLGGGTGVCRHSDSQLGPAAIRQECAAQSQASCDEVRGIAAKAGVEITEISTNMQVELVAHHPAFDTLLDGFAPPELSGNPKVRSRWATEQVKYAARANRNLGLTAHASFSGALAWPFFYPCRRSGREGLIDEAFKELARRWEPILDAFDEAGVDVCFELHPGEDLHDGVTFERFLVGVQAIILAPTSFMIPATWSCSRWIIWRSSTCTMIGCGRSCERRGISRAVAAALRRYQDWIDRPGRFRSLGNDADFTQNTSARWRSTIFRVGRSWSGSAASSTSEQGAPGRCAVHCATITWFQESQV